MSFRKRILRWAWGTSHQGRMTSSAWTVFRNWVEKERGGTFYLHDEGDVNGNGQMIAYSWYRKLYCPYGTTWTEGINVPRI